MIEINKQGNAIRIDFTDNDKYLFNGTMEVASNELMLVVDESDMITFKRTTNGDVLFSQAVNKIKIAGSAVTKDNVIEQFATIGYSQSGGGGGETGAVTSVNGQTGEVVLTASSLNAYTKTQTDDLINGVRTIANDANSKADAVTSRVQNVETSLGNKQDTLVSGVNIKTVNGQSIVGEGDVVIEGTDSYTKTESDAKYATAESLNTLNGTVSELGTAVEATNTELAKTKTDVTNLTSKVNEDSQKIASLDTEMNNKANSADVPTNTQFNNLAGEVANKADKTSVYTKQEVDNKVASKQDALIAGNGITITKSENKTVISSTSPTVQAGETGTADNYIYSAGSGNKNVISQIETNSDVDDTLKNPNYVPIKVTGWNGQGVTGASTRILGATSERAGVMSAADKTKLDGIDMTTKQDKLTSGENIKTINGDSILGSGNLVIQSGTSNWDDIQGKPQFARVATSGDYNDLINKPTIPDVSGLATKEEIADMETKSNAAATYATKQEIPSLAGYLTETAASETYATKQDMAGKQDTLVSGTNIKTINGNSILGEGNIEITSDSKVWTATADKNIRVETNTDGAISLSNWTGYNTAKPGDVVHITYSNYNWNLVVTGRYKDNTGTWLVLNGLGTMFTSYRIDSRNQMYSYVPFNQVADKAIVIGRGAVSNGGTKYEVAIGIGATTNGTNAVAIGSDGTSANANATAVGSQADANEDGSTVIGSSLKANKQDGSTPEKVLVGYYDTANSTSVPVLAYNESDGARIKSGNSLKKIATDDQLPSSADITKLQSLPNFVTLTQSEYDALGTKDQNTVYLIKEA